MCTFLTGSTDGAVLKSEERTTRMGCTCVRRERKIVAHRSDSCLNDYQHIKSDINDTKCMLQNRQTDTESLPGAAAMEMSIQEEFCTGKGVPREPCAHMSSIPASRRDLTLSIYPPAYCRRHPGSQLHTVCSSSGGGSSPVQFEAKGERGMRLHCSHLVHHGR